MDMKYNGRRSFAQKTIEIQAIQEIDQFTDLTFPVVGSKFLDSFLGYPYVSIVEHPGVVLIVRDKDWQEVVIEMIKAILGIWPLVLMNILVMLVAGFIVWLLVSYISEEHSYKVCYKLSINNHHTLIGL